MTFLRRTSLLLVCFLLGRTSIPAASFRFGGSGGGGGIVNPRFFRSTTTEGGSGSGGETYAAAAAGLSASPAASAGRPPKAKELPRRFPMRNLPIIGDITNKGTTSRVAANDAGNALNKDENVDSDATDGEDLDEHDDDEAFHSIVNDMVADIDRVSGEIEVEDDGGDDDDDNRKSGGKRVTFFASKEFTRTISLDKRYSQFLDEYMTLPLEQYSVKSFHDGGPDKMEGRRWFLRRLTAEESSQYLEYEPRDNHEEYIQNIPPSSDDGSCNSKHDGQGRFFRLAVPLAPLIGVELTPVIDLEVIPALKPQTSESTESNDNEGDEGKSQTIPESAKRPARRPLRAVRRVLRRGRRGRQRSDDNGVGDVGVVRVQSLRVSLLSTEDEVKALMRTRKRASKPNAKPTQVSQNPSVQQIGSEAIGVVGKVEQAIQPHITFDAQITWNSADGGGQYHGASVPSVTVRSTAVTSLTIPKIPTAFRVPLPLPLGILVRRIGTLLTKRALEITLPRFLGQLERDLERWAKGDKGDER